MYIQSRLHLTPTVFGDVLVELLDVALDECLLSAHSPAQSDIHAAQLIDQIG